MNGVERTTTKFDHVVDRKGSGSVKWDANPLTQNGADILPMWLADMDFQAPASVIEAIVQRAQHGIYGYTMRETYFKALQRWLLTRHHWDVDVDWMVNVPGVVPALGMLVESLTAPGDHVILQRPVYYPFENVIARSGRTVVNNALVLDGNQYTMDFNLLEQQARDAKLLLLCNPHNPVGRVWTQEELSRLGQICLAHDVIVVSDEIHGDLVYHPGTFKPFASLHPAFAQQSVTCVSASKTFNLAGLHTATIIAPNSSLRETFQRFQQRFSLGSGDTFGVIATDSAYRTGEAWLDALIQYVQENLESLCVVVEKHLHPLRVIQPEGTYLVWIDCRGLGIEDVELERRLIEQAGLRLDMGTMFGPEGAGFVRINIATPRRTLEEALGRLQHIL